MRGFFTKLYRKAIINQMPRLKITKTSKQSSWGLWYISESEERLSFEAMETCPEEVLNPQKRLEWLAGRVLIRSLVEHAGLTYCGIHKDEFGKPYLKELPHHISLSHSYPYVAAQIDRNQSVGIDLEQPKEKLLTIAHRVLARDEQINAGTDVIKHCVYWCAKEAMYKVFGKRGLHFSSQLLVKPFDLKAAGQLSGQILADTTHQVSLGYLIQADYVLVYTQPAFE
jgi:4'-phosphopantetheinyl transferase